MTSEVKLKLPNCIYIETTNRCNLTCKSCIHYKDVWEPAREFSLKEVEFIADQLPGLDRAVLHGAGEPLLCQELPAIIKYLKSRKATVLFNTNGVLLDGKRRQALINSGLDELRVSLDAASSATYKVIRNSNKFELILKNLRAFSREIKTQKIKTPKLSLWFLGHRKNISELYDFIQLAASLEISEVYLQRFIYCLDEAGYGVAKSEYALSDRDPEVINLIERSHELAQKLGIRLASSGLHNNPLLSIRKNTAKEAGWKNCYRFNQVLYVTVNGNILPCCMVPFTTTDYHSTIIGNVLKDPVPDIWFDQKFQKLREQIKTSSPPHFCRGCGVLWSI
ncbi:radical SAM/SPASM domain-containing protein [candidate division CSSED10-310 bacterium]|uniref:Radical SAM/SPASM domain-containing protein n=1 Tax=candidate division CSSED10-310 bacterium TaxID=2855610 RepID=A0ABV6Z265_UNCC1